jgi:hypothetical protein
LLFCRGQLKRLEVVDEWIETTFKGREFAQDFVNSQPWAQNLNIENMLLV